MDLSSITHRADSEYAYLYKRDVMHIRIKTKRDDVSSIILHYGDSVIFFEDSYQYSEEMFKVLSDSLFDYWEIFVQVDYARIQYIFEVKNGQERILFGDRGPVPYSLDNLNNFMNGFRLPYFHEIDRCKVPEWVSNTIWYQIFPERFCNGNEDISPQEIKPWDYSIKPGNFDFFGGDLQGVLDKLDYLVDLGITGIYFCPIFESPSNHKYDTLDYYEIDKHFGDKLLFKKLIEEAHNRGIKIMLDAVFNHIGHSSKQWQDVIKNGEDSKYKDWFHIQKFPVTTKNLMNNRELTYHAFAFQGGMPKLNTSNHEVKKYLLDIATYWVKNFDIDAWRLDVANEIDHEFWKDFRKAVLAIKPSLYILGEIWHSSQPWLNGDEFHAVMNYPLSDSIKEYFLTREKSVENFVSDLAAQSFYYKRQVTEVMFNLLDSHDTERILTTAQGELSRVKAALLFLFLQIGTPCIYYGTELAMIGGPDPDCRRAMPWEKYSNENEFYNFVKKIITVRKKYSNLITFGHQKIEIIDQDVIRVSYYDKDTKLIAYFNSSNNDISIQPNGIIVLSDRLIKFGGELLLSRDGLLVQVIGGNSNAIEK
ncbi:TPA: alpha-glycosidase [Streptococcus suis]|nr:alpha-glycosidase [Streptococcus suis]